MTAGADRRRSVDEHSGTAASRFPLKEALELYASESEHRQDYCGCAVGRRRKRNSIAVKLVAIEQDAVVIDLGPGEFQAMIEPSEPALRLRSSVRGSGKQNCCESRAAWSRYGVVLSSHRQWRSTFRKVFWSVSVLTECRQNSTAGFQR